MGKRIDEQTTDVFQLARQFQGVCLLVPFDGTIVEVGAVKYIIVLLSDGKRQRDGRRVNRFAFVWQIEHSGSGTVCLQAIGLDVHDDRIASNRDGAPRSTLSTLVVDDLRPNTRQRPVSMNNLTTTLGIEDER